MGRRRCGSRSVEGFHPTGESAVPVACPRETPPCVALSKVVVKEVLRIRLGTMRFVDNSYGWGPLWYGMTKIKGPMN